jgi:hypothetical protein
MASPFSVFRRNQRVLLAIVAITAMVAFVFLDPLMKYVGRRAKSENPIVVETKYGSLNYVQLESMRASRELVEHFLQNVTAKTVMSQLNKGLIDPRLRDQAMNQLFGFWQQMLMGRSKPGPEESAIETWILSRKAEQLGMVVSDRAINDLLRQITDNSLDGDELQATIHELQAGGRRRISVARLFDAIRTEMLASKVSQLFFQSLRDIPPAQRFEYYERLNRRAKVEVMPLAVASFVGQVSEEPNNEALRAFYEAHKNSYPDATSPEPGFKEPKRASFQYFKADFAKLKDEFKPQVTEDEIREYYEKNKSQFRAVELPSEKATEENAAEESKEAPPKSDDAAPEAKDEKQSQPPKTEGDKKESPQQNPADAAKPNEPTPPEAKPGSEPQAGGPRSTIRLVSQQTAGEAASDEAKAAPADEKPAEPATKPPAEAPAKEAATEPAEAPDAKADLPKAPAAGAEAADQDATENDAKEPAEEIKYEPLEKVADTIRDSIAAQKANARMLEIFEELQAAMRRYADERDLFNARPEAQKSTPPPVFPFEELAKPKNVEAKALVLVTAAEAAQTDIGQVQRVVRRSQFDFQSVPFAEFAFADSFVVYKPEAGQDGEGNGYLFWKTEEKLAFVPQLDKIRDKVVFAWKLTKARDKARRRADELAGQARTAKKPLNEVFAGEGDLKVTETNPFSWLSAPNVPQDPSGSLPRISQVDGVEHPGDEFMETVFNLSPGEIGVALNQPKDTVYVIRLIEFDRPLEQLRDEFASEPPMRYLSAADAERRTVYVAWLDDVKKDAGLHWLRQPDVTKSRRAPAEGPPEEADL